MGSRHGNLLLAQTELPGEFVRCVPLCCMSLYALANIFYV